MTEQPNGITTHTRKGADMKITPIEPIIKPRNHLQRKRAAMAINSTQHTVIDLDTGKRFDLPAKEAWELYEHINELV